MYLNLRFFSFYLKIYPVRVSKNKKKLINFVLLKSSFLVDSLLPGLNPDPLYNLCGTTSLLTSHLHESLYKYLDHLQPNFSFSYNVHFSINSKCEYFCWNTLTKFIIISTRFDFDSKSLFYCYFRHN